MCKNETDNENFFTKNQFLLLCVTLRLKISALNNVCSTAVKN